MALRTKTKAKQKMTLEEVTEILARVSTPLSLYLVPENLKEEREKFFASGDYNPVFRYREAQKKNREVFAQLKDLKEVSGVPPEISKYIRRVIKHKKQAAALLAAIGDNDKFIKVSEERFGTPTYILFNKACKILRRRYGDIRLAKRNKELQEKKFAFNDLVPVFEKAFKFLGLDDWTVEKSEAIISSGFRTASKTRRIMVDPNIKTHGERLKKTIVHEVATHALRASNGFKTGYEFLGKPNVVEQLDAEEGLAFFNEERFGVLRDIDIRRWAALVYAAHLGKTMSFRQVFDALHSIYPRNNTFDVVYRVKRGLADTSKPGCYYKDITYLRGFLSVRKALHKNNVAYANMYAGKLPLKYLHLVEEGIIPKAETVPTRELMNRLFKEIGLE